jgi:hypothetical protein
LPNGGVWRFSWNDRDLGCAAVVKLTGPQYLGGDRVWRASIHPGRVVTLTAVASAAVYDDEAVTLASGVGIVLTVAGILAIELGSQNSQRRCDRGQGINWLLLIAGAILILAILDSS